MKKSFSPFIYLFLFFVALPSPAKADITIGLIGPFSGSNAAGGEQLKQGAEQAVTDINAEGGINGEKLAIRIFDDACDPKQAVTAANQVTNAGIKFVVGFYCSSAAIPASKVFMEDGVLLVASSVSNPKVTDEAKDLVFRAYGRDDIQGAVLGKYIATHYRDKKIAIIEDKSTYGLGIAQETQKALNENGVKEILFDAYTVGERDYSSLITRLKQAGTQVLFIGGYYTEAGLITRQIKEQGATIQIISDDALTTDQFWSIAGPAAEGVLMTFGPDPRKRAEAKTVVNEMRKGGAEPDGATLYAYASVQTVAEGIRRAGKRDPLKVAKALRTTAVPTVLGPITYNAKGDMTGDTFVLYRWHNGKYEEIGNEGI